jgi:hypothetical protein
VSRDNEEEPGLEAPRVCVVSASGQNVFFGEILTALADALRGRGVAVEEAVDRFPPAAPDLVYLFVPHEYEPMVDELARPTPVQLRRSVALCTEQPGTSWFETSAGIAARAGAAVDLNALGVAELTRRGIEAAHLALGYVPGWDAWGGDPDRERTVDVAFLGAHTDRRARALARCVPALERRRAAIHLVETSQPHVAGSDYFLANERKWRLLANTRVLVNVHQAELAYLEWHRVLGAIANGCVVLSEHSLGIDPLVPGEHFVSASYDDLPRVLEGLLSDPERIARIRAGAYELVREQLPVENTADALLTAVERAACNPVPDSELRRPAPGPMPVVPPPPPPEWELRAELLGEQLPVRLALRHVMSQLSALERRVAALASSDGDGSGDSVEQLGPELGSPRVSVLLTVHDYADLVGEALRSVALCDLDGVEVIAVDDGSTDGSADAIRRACAELPWLSVRLVRRAVNQGLPAARNLAAEHARAELLFVLDADNQVLPRGPGLLADALDADPSAAFAYGVIQTFDATGPRGLTSWRDWDPARLRQGSYVDAMAMIRRTALEQVGGYPTDAAFAGGWEDFAVWVAMADAGLHGIRVPDFVARYRTGPHSMIALTDVDHSAAWAALLRRYPSLATDSRFPAGKLDSLTP